MTCTVGTHLNIQMECCIVDGLKAFTHVPNLTLIKCLIYLLKKMCKSWALEVIVNQISPFNVFFFLFLLYVLELGLVFLKQIKFRLITQTISSTIELFIFHLIPRHSNNKNSLSSSSLSVSNFNSVFFLRCSGFGILRSLLQGKWFTQFYSHHSSAPISFFNSIHCWLLSERGLNNCSYY